MQCPGDSGIRQRHAYRTREDYNTDRIATMSSQLRYTRKPRVVIVGAGVTGLTVATCLTETYGNQLDISLIADKFSPDITSDRAGADLIGGIWWYSGDKQRQAWTSSSLQFFEQLYCSSSPAMREKIGLRKVQGYRMFKKLPADPWCFEKLPEYFNRKLSREETEALGPAYDGYIVYDSTLFLLKGSLYMPWLMDKLRVKGSLIQQHKVESLSELTGYDVIINCTGLRSYELVGDKSLYPTRGQSVVVRAPSINRFHTFADSGSTEMVYIFPHKDHVIIGGTVEPHNWSTTRDPDTDRDILQRCSRFEPSLEEADVIGGWACLRPSRESVRLEVEDPSATPAVVHNYGHGGSGFLLSWGCAMDTVGLVKQCLEEKGFRACMPAKL